jgi:pimeloyl-ACP methyl ester carboxylesterase
MNKTAALLATLALASVSACAQVPAAAPVQPQTQQVPGTLLIGGTEYSVAWGLPAAGTALGLAVVEHGFSRRCTKIAGTLDTLVAAGLMTLCVDAPLAGGNAALADALAATLVAGVTPPDGSAVPERIVVGGHSAGGAFAVRLGFTLAQIAPQRLTGAVLFDPVASGSRFVDEIRGLSQAGQRPVLTVSANAGGCNANNNSYPGLRAVAADAAVAGNDSFVGIQLTDRSTHVDVEAGDTDAFAWIACRQGPPRRANVDALRTLGAAWAADLARGTRTPEFYPGGSFVEALLADSRAVLINQE